MEIGNEMINVSDINITNFITESYGKVEVNATGIIRDVCQFKYDYIYANNIKYLMMLTLIFMIIMIISKLSGLLFSFNKKIVGIDKKGIFINYQNLGIPYIKSIFHAEKEYINEDLKITLLLIYIFRMVFVYFAYFDTFPFIHIMGF